MGERDRRGTWSSGERVRDRERERGRAEEEKGKGNIKMVLLNCLTVHRAIYFLIFSTNMSNTHQYVILISHGIRHLL